MAKSLHTSEYEAFRKLLLTAREEAGLTQLEVATRLSKPQSFVAKYEGGERRLDVIEFMEICEALKVDPNVLINKLRAVIMP
jgi:transcriptional regulator with XRE-family HTH domain